jgi:hypothetical protein
MPAKLEGRLDQIKRAHVKLASLRQNLPASSLISQMYIEEYHGALDHLERLGFDISEFRVPQHAMRMVRFNFDRDGSIHVERSMLLTKLDAVLGYFAEDEDKPPIGFQAPLKG